MKMMPQRHTVQRARNLVILGALSLTLCACGSSKINISESKNVQDAVDAATGPLEDLNIKKREIPEVLKTAALNPYARPKVVKCLAVREEIAKYDELLGPDMAPKEVEVASADDSFVGQIENFKTPTRDQVEDHVGDYAHDTIIRMISHRVNVIPFRSIVRTITGANRYQAKVTEAYEAGKLRRAYLKGFATEHFGKKCFDLDLPKKKDEPLPETVASNDTQVTEESETTAVLGGARRR